VNDDRGAFENAPRLSPGGIICRLFFANPPNPSSDKKTMKVLVSVKRVVDYNVKVRVKSDGTGGRDRERENVHESLRRDRGRGGGTPEGSWRRHRDHRGVVRPLACQETLRKALAIGADRAILVETDVDLQPLAVAKLPQGRFAPGSAADRDPRQEAIDDDSTRPGR